METEVAKNLLEIDVILDADIPAIRLRAEHVTCPMAGLYKCAYLQWQGDGGKCDKDDVSSEKNENNNSTILDAEEQEQRGSYDITVEGKGYILKNRWWWTCGVDREKGKGGIDSQVFT